MKQIKSIIEKVEYTTYTYYSIEEKNNHIKKMEQDGYELLDNFEHRKEAIFRKFY
ncbi:hypothetical protein KHQ82_03175 [Mycoplasmatota bacterium]|nr:hypothetical protein KHQ82_03175 [Mycoplasmatota bacterium]